MTMTKIQEKQNNELRLASAMNKFQELAISAVTSGNNPHFKSTYSTLADVIKACRQGNQFGLFFTQHTIEKEGKCYVKTVVRHINDTDTYDACLAVPCANLTNAHQLGSGITYAKRFTLQSLYGLPSEDDDGNGAVASPTINPQVQNEINKNNIM
jgi:hypothetical protein